MTVAWIVAAITLAQIVKGATGFGSALVAMPLLASTVAPTEALGISAAADLVAGAVLAPGAAKRQAVTALLPLVAAMAIGQQLGIALLTVLNPNLTSLAIASVVAVMAVRVSRPPRALANVGSEGRGLVPGLLGGTMGGLVGMSGPPIVAWASQRFPPAAARDALILIFAAGSLLQIASLTAHGLWRPAAVHLAVIPAVAIGNLIGIRLADRLGDDARRSGVAGLLALCAATLAWQTLP